MEELLERLVIAVEQQNSAFPWDSVISVSYTHLRAHETGRNLVCRLLLEKKKDIKEKWQKKHYQKNKMFNIHDRKQR